MTRAILSTRDVERWLNPHPIGFKERNAKWYLKVITIAVASKLFSIWNYPERTSPRRSIAWWASNVIEGTAPIEQHYIRELARSWAPVATSLTVLVVQKRRQMVVVDGNHRLVALNVAKAGFDGCTTRLTHVGVLTRKT